MLRIARWKLPFLLHTVCSNLFKKVWNDLEAMFFIRFGCTFEKSSIFVPRIRSHLNFWNRSIFGRARGRKRPKTRQIFKKTDCKPIWRPWFPSYSTFIVPKNVVLGASYQQPPQPWDSVNIWPIQRPKTAPNPSFIKGKSMKCEFLCLKCYLGPRNGILLQLFKVLCVCNTKVGQIRADQIRVGQIRTHHCG